METRLPLVIYIAMCLILLREGECALQPAESEHDVCTSEHDPRLLSTCRLGGQFSQGYQCQVTPGLTCLGELYVGEGSVCTRRGSTGGQFIRCSRGVWQGNLDSEDEDLPPHNIKRRWGIRVRFIRIRFRRAACYVGRVINWRSRCSGGGGGGGGSAPPANRPPYFTHCPSVPPQTADPGTLTTAVNWSLPTATDPDGETPSVTAVGSQKSGSVFREGSTTVLYKARDSKGGTDYCVVNVQVTVVTCNTGYRQLQNGDQQCSGARLNIYGSQCSHHCHPGYQLTGGSSVVQCQSNGEWSGSFPTCQAVSCGAPNIVEGGSMACPSGHQYPSVCIITCQRGYSHSGLPFVQCQNNKAWTTAAPCVDTEAPHFPAGCPANQQLYSGPLKSPVTVTWTDPEVKDNSNQAVTLTSSVAKTSTLDVGFHVIWVTAEDTAGNSASCNFVVNVQARTCNSIQAPFDSRVTCSHGYIEGSECTVTCNPGYQLQGDATTRCESSGSWNSPLPVCKVMSCPAPPTINNGNFLQCSGGVEFKSVCILTCDPGFKVQGSLSIQCQGDATWSAAGSCEDTEAPQFLNSPCLPNIDVFASRLGQPTLVNFSHPPVTDNSGHVTLTSDVTSGTSFPIGVTQVTFTATDLAGNSRTCQFTVTVTSLACDTPDLELSNRSRTLMTYACPDGYVHGATCALGCKYTYPLMGSSNITCEADDYTYPPTMEWVWPEPHLGKPECKEDTCPKLRPPTNGALSCFMGNFGQDCLMSCNQNWDIPAYTDGRFYCPFSSGFWIPGTVPDCLVRLRPGSIKMQTDMFYYTGSCSTSLDTLKQNFVDRISNSTWKDACVGVISCVWQNVQVTCGPVQGMGKRKREADPRNSHLHRVIRTAQQHQFHRQKRQSFYVLVEFDIVLEYTEGNQTPQETFQTYGSVIADMYSRLQADASAGHFNMAGLTTDGNSVGYPRTAIDCPPGTMFKDLSTTKSYSCTGCSPGRYLAVNSKQCEQCPRGQYSEEDQATSCRPCPQGWSTPSTGAQHQNQCRELCLAGSFSPDGFVPCQACPPGHYQSQNGSSHCSPCPAGTWTSASNATSLQDCRDSDVYLSSNQSLTAKVTSQWDASGITLRLWLRMGVNSSCQVSLHLGNPPMADSVILGLYSSVGDAFPQNGSGLTHVQRVKPTAWTSVLFTVQPATAGGVSPAGGDVKLYVQGAHLRSSQLGVAVGMALSLRVTATVAATSSAIEEDSEVLVSGLRTDSGSVDAANISEALTTCTGDKSTNLMTWVPSPSSIFIPSSCDAVDECQSSPCGAQGECQNLQSGYRCDCQDGWSGGQCQVPPGVCYQHPCQNGASCVPLQPAAAGGGGGSGINNNSSSSNFSCVCDDQHSGALCELEKVPGGWGSWAEWQACSATCGGVQQRHRLCDNPAPLHQGMDCAGAPTETVPCGTTVCPVNGGFGPWTPFSDCSATCGGGERTRQRKCDSPAPQNGGTLCVGPSKEKKTCNSQECPVDGGWGPWNAWEFCSVTCGNGSQSRERSCDTPVPSNGGQQCVGSANETRVCDLGDCPACSQLTRPAGALLVCVEETSPSYMKTCNLTCLPGHMSTSPLPLYSCGESTGYLWNHQRDQSTNTTPGLPVCTRPRTINSVIIYQEALLSTPCVTEEEDSAVRQNVYGNVAATVPCMLQNQCTTTVSSDCYDPSPSSFRRRRRRRSASVSDPMSVIVEVTMPLGSSQVLDANDTASVTAYEQLLMLADQTYSMMTAENDTAASFYHVTVNGHVITPVNVSSDVTGSCPSGHTLVGEVCVECPVGSKEEEAECVMCPLGQYQDQSASTSCKPCPQGRAWDVLGATSVSQCLFSYSSNNDDDDDVEESDDDHIPLIVGLVCAAVVVIAFIVGIVVIVHKMGGQKDARNRWARPSSALSISTNRVGQTPDPDSYELQQAPALHRSVTPSALKMHVLLGRGDSLPPLSANPRADGPQMPPVQTTLPWRNQWTSAAAPLPPLKPVD